MHAPASVEASSENPKDLITMATMTNLISSSRSTHPRILPKLDKRNACDGAGETRRSPVGKRNKKSQQHRAIT